MREASEETVSVTMLLVAAVIAVVLLATTVVVAGLCCCVEGLTAATGTLVPRGIGIRVTRVDDAGTTSGIELTD